MAVTTRLDSPVLFADSKASSYRINTAKRREYEEYLLHHQQQNDDSSLLYRCAMVDFGYWGDLALQTWVNINPSTQWANKQIEPYRGLPFGTYLHAAPPRRRRLTGPLDPSQTSLWQKVQVMSSLEPEQRTDEQPTCGFLQKLPYDVRLIIYEMVLGGQTLHLYAQKPKSRILYNVCKHPKQIDDSDAHQNCHDLSAARPSSAPREDYLEATGLLPLLTTCRKIYSEAINTLYASNTFEFNQIFAAFGFLKLNLPQQRLPSIRHFRLHLRIPRHPLLNSRATRDWQDLWAFFDKQMTGLQKLYVQLLMLHTTEAAIQSTRDEEAEKWIKPMIVMAMNAHNRRACVVQIQTRNQRHEPAKIFLEQSARYPDANPQEVMDRACTALHGAIRISLG